MIFVLPLPLTLLISVLSRNVQECYPDKFSRFRSRIFQKLEPRVAAGKKRVRWICVSRVVNTVSINANMLKSSCGRPLCDDFQEVQPGAIAKLQQDLNERYETTKRRANSGSPVSSGNSQDGKSRNSKRSFGQWWSRWRSSGGRLPTLPLCQRL